MTNPAQQPEERTINFALAIRCIVKPDGTTQVVVRSENQGIPDAEVILTVEAWLDKIKAKCKEERIAGLQFGKGQHT